MGTIASPQETARMVMDRPAEREVVPLVSGQSFRWIEHDYPAQIARWNYHPEIEIHLIRRSRGSYIIGDQVGEFGPGHVALVGADVPHDWMSDLGPDESIPGRDVAIQFTAEWLGRCSETIPELSELAQLVVGARRGIVFSGTTAVEAGLLIERVGRAVGTERISTFLALLNLLQHAPTEDREYVADELYSSDVGQEGRAAVDAGLAYVTENLGGHIRMSEAAKLAFMSEPSFSKYFKKASGMTFSDLVKRLRISSACRLLEQTESTISEISALAGYGNLANFNRQFRSELGVTPSQYRSLDASSKPSIRPVSLGTKHEG